jgi:hypothetical protein
VVEGRPLDEIFREIEGHRGYRPKGSVILLYNRVLEPRAPEHYAEDPTAALLRRCALGAYDPYEDDVHHELEQRRANLEVQPPFVGRTARSGDTGSVAH